MAFGIALTGLLALQTAGTVGYWTQDRIPARASGRLRVASVLTAIGLLVLVGAGWDGLGVDAKDCSSLARPSDAQSSKEYVLGSCLVAAALAVVPAVAATRSRRGVKWLAGLALAATVVAWLYFASHVYWANCYL